LGEVGNIGLIPDDFLWNLPFQALITERGKYLIEERAIFYAPSLTVMRRIQDRRTKNSSGSLLAFANPSLSASAGRLEEELCPLPEAESEVKSIRTANSKILVGAQATEAAFKSMAPQASTIHLATHGILDNRNPLYSYLLLTSGKDSEDDGFLEAREVMDLRLRANLVVLSACETANGRIAPGEGVMGMSWAFFVAGAKSLVVSGWKVNSASTARLMAEFYRSLHRTGKARSLQQAELSLLRIPAFRHPFYWAGFVLVGLN
jgi:CHAT domain-containing protein